MVKKQRKDRQQGQIREVKKVPAGQYSKPPIKRISDASIASPVKKSRMEENKD